MKLSLGSGFLVVLLLALLAAPVQAAVITVDDASVDETVNGLCSINEAIENANVEEGDPIHSDCADGEPGLDTIQLTVDVVAFDVASRQEDGFNATESITSEIIIDGGGSFSLSNDT